MKVLFCIRNDYKRNFAGDSMQAIKTAEYLIKNGVEVDINDGSISDFSSYDLVHLFNLTRMGETYKYYKMARYYKKTIVLSPIYWNLKKYFRYVSDYESIRLWDKCTIYRKEILRGCSLVYPNSVIEMELLKGEFGCNVPCTVIYNGIEPESDDMPLYNFLERYNLDNYVLCAGRICKRKNQLVLSEVCDELGIKLVLIGNVNDKDYFNKCLQHNNVTHLGFMDNYNMYNAYRFAKLHAMPSFVETPGLSSLEAAAAGCRIVTTNEGSAEEYFGDMAVYCDPYDRESIKRAVAKGYKLNKCDKLKKHIVNKFNWDTCVKKLYESYESIINGSVKY